MSQLVVPSMSWQCRFIRDSGELLAPTLSPCEWSLSELAPVSQSRETMRLPREPYRNHRLSLKMAKISSPPPHCHMSLSMAEYWHR